MNPQNPSPESSDKSTLEFELKKLAEEKSKQLEELKKLEEIEKQIEKEKAELEGKVTPKSPTSTEENEVEKEDDTELKLASLKTYQGDIARAISEKKESLLTIKLAEEKRRTYVAETSTSSKKIYWLIPTLLCAGILIFVGARFFMKEDVVIETPPVRENIISYDNEVKVEVDSTKREDLISAITSVKKAQTQSGDQIFSIDIRSNTGSSTPSDTIMRLFIDPVPEELKRTLEEERLVGIYREGEKGYPFLIFKVNSYENAFSSILSSEKKIEKDFASLLNNRTSLDENYAVAQEFVDLYVENKDARALKDTFGNTLFLYSFIDTKTLVIAHNEKSLSEIIRRYFTLQQVK